MSKPNKRRRVRPYQRDLKKQRYFTLLVWDEGEVRASGAYYTTYEAADEALLHWDRVTGHDNHPVYALGVVKYYRNPKRRVERREMVRCVTQMLKHQQLDRLALVALLDSAKKFAR